MPYWRLLYHIVWATKGREPTLVGEVESTVHRVIRQVGVEMEVDVIAIGSMPDHIHVVVSIPPSRAIADVVKLMKGRATFAANHDSDGRRTASFAWQSEYGVLSFGDQALPNVVDYVTHQRERHGGRDLWGKLERLVPVSTPPEPNASPVRTSLN